MLISLCYIDCSFPNNNISKNNILLKFRDLCIVYTYDYVILISNKTLDFLIINDTLKLYSQLIC